MRIHILGICGSFMGGIAVLARELGHEITGSDANVYPPMSTWLADSGIALQESYDPAPLAAGPDLVIVGNALGRGNPSVEYLLDGTLRYISGPQWLYEEVLRGRHVLAVSGTHGKTTTSAMLAWILEVGGLAPGFLIGGVPGNFAGTARFGGGRYFVVEADEYDTAFFDKRSKFVHYRPKTLIINTIEYDHADIFCDLAAIRREFHHLVRIMPAHGLILARQGDAEISQVLAMGCWTPVETFGDNGARWQAKPLRDDYSEFEIVVDGKSTGVLRWGLIGRHNAGNALAAIAAAHHVGMTPGESCEALSEFRGVKRRLERLARINGIAVYDDFAHHPTEIRETLTALRQRVGREDRIIAVMEPRSNSMRLGVHREALPAAFSQADHALLYQADNLEWDLARCTASLGEKRRVFTDLESIVDAAAGMSRDGDHIVIMSNGDFGGLHRRLIERLERAC